MQCIQCKKEFQPVKAYQKCCSPKCRLQYHRHNETGNSPVSKSPVSPVSSETPAPVSKPENETPELSVPADLSKLTTQELYQGINFYVADTWAKSPEYLELLRRLDKLSIKELKEQGFQIPSWKLNGLKCPFKDGRICFK